MTSRAALSLVLNIIFFTMVSTTSLLPSCPPPPKTTYTPSSPPPKSTYTPSPPPPQTPSPPPPKTTYTPSPPPPKTTYTSSPPPPKTTYTPSTSPSTAKCPKDTLKLGVCANLLNDLVHLKIGNPPKTPCCPLIEGLVDLEAAVCLCTAIKANVLGVIKLKVSVSLGLLLNYCGKKVPSGFQCAY